jgi:ABC-type Fe3+-hydroxamate transport system substrate-binding protein
MTVKRVVSLVPSLTELVWWLGCGDRMVGRTRFCTEPAAQVEGTPPVGGTKNPDIPAILSLRPDIVLANKEENRREDVEALRGAGLDVLVTDPNSVAEAAEMIATIGRLLGREERARELVDDIDHAVAESGPSWRPRVFVAVWRRPLLGLGGGTYGHDVLQLAGADNLLGHRKRYPEVDWSELRDLRPDLILLPDEPYRFGTRHVREFSLAGPARVVDGRMLWWYGPRIPAALRTLRALFAESAQDVGAPRPGSRQ